MNDKVKMDVPEEFIESTMRVRQAATMKEKLEAFNEERELIEKGSSEAVARHHAKQKMLARERLAALLDSGSFNELDLWHRPYETGFDIGEGSGQGDGVVIGFGAIDHRQVTVWAQDATVMNGTVGTVHARKVIQMMEQAVNNRTPIISIVDSAGIRAHDAIQYPDFYSFGAMAYFQTLASGVIPKISLVMGPCTGELAVISGLSDFVFMVQGSSYMHLMPPPQGSSATDIGDARNVHARVGTCDVIADNEAECLTRCRELLSYLPSSNMESCPIVDTGDDAQRREEELLTIAPVEGQKMYNMYRLLSLVLDNGQLFEIKRHFARNLITGFGRLEGRTVGILANNPQFKAGCMDLDSADKMTKFVRFCDAFNIPLVFFADTPAFLPAVDEERRGLIRHGSAMIMANTMATVPQITMCVRKHYGGGRLAMPGQFLGGDIQVSWPTYDPGVMGAKGAVAIIYGKEIADVADLDQRKALESKRIDEMQWQLDMLKREATQLMIDPRDTRPFLINALRWLRNKRKDLPNRKHDNICM